MVQNVTAAKLLVVVNVFKIGLYWVAAILLKFPFLLTQSKQSEKTGLFASISGGNEINKNKPHRTGNEFRLYTTENIGRV